ncbi:glyoxalase/Bleomycin resistance /Dioxygenase superfamily protein [Gordonia sp. NB41Y]|uniref:VOC family protein n=1 Tax=Gordonia sp. NB41Y TaxID=875808 RepID=UPI0002BFD44A|nr:glyoxalase/Bleomycin resistance /Dioxygenase superfamily protein [Gordonia sp. NB41Y]WLP90852.1 glyoxalase/bleomycin resistance/dioxygenase family protein [Gordonia sp. NB41Y]
MTSHPPHTPDRHTPERPVADAHAVAVLDLVTADPAGSAKAYQQLLGHAAADTDIHVGNARIRLHDKTSDDPHRVLFTSSDTDAQVRLLQRRGLDLHHRHADEWHAPDVPVGVITHAPAALPARADDIAGLDHLVFESTDRDHAVALFGSTLGLDFRLDRQVSPGLRQLFFRAGDLVVEVVLADGAPATEPISLWGIAWRSHDVTATHRRLTDLGVGISEVRVGRKPGTAIATVYDPLLATRTVVIGPLDG